MVAIQNPLMGLNMDANTAKYVGILESQIARHAIQEVQFRTLLELLTDESWEDVKIDGTGDMIQKIAIDSLVRQGVDKVTAATTVKQRWAKYNGADFPKAVAVENLAPKAIPRTHVTVSTGTLADRIEDWRIRNKAQKESDEKKL